MHIKLGPKFVIFLLVVLLPSILTIGIFFHQKLQDLLLQQIDSSLNNSLLFTRSYLERNQVHMQNTATVIATDPALRKALDRDNSLGINSHLNRIIRVYPDDLNYLILVDSSRTVFAVNTIGANKKKVPSEELLGQKLDKHPLFIDFESHSSGYSAPGYDPYLSKFGLSHSITAQWFVAPVIVRGKPLGWIVLSYKWQTNTTKLQQDLIELLVEDGHSALSSGILDENNRLIAGQRTIIGNSLEKTLPITINDAPFTLAIQFDQARALAVLDQQRKLLLTISIPFVLIVLLAIYILVIKQLLNPIRRLQEGVQRFSDGDLNYRLPEHGNDELTQLSHSFNIMGDELVSAKANLEQQVDERTWDLTTANEHLAQAIQRAEQANTAKSSFLASMSHEIRSPMNGVLGMLSLLGEQKLSEQQRHYVDVARSSAESLLTLINDILDFSKIEAGKLTLEVIDFNIVSQLSEFAEVMTFRTKEKNIELILDVSEIQQPMVKGDPSRIRQILTNLVGNAIKFTESGEIVIKATLKETAESSLQFHCSVSDTGIGIPKDKIDGLFDVFTQVDNSTTREYGGTGLGLSIVKQLCELMHGSVHVSSNLDKGSCFEFTLRLEASDKLVPALPNVDLNNIPVLIADRNDTHRGVLRKYLEQWDMKVSEANDGLSVLSALAEEAFKVVIIDNNIPDMGGAALGKSIRKDERFADTEMIIMTSVGQKGDAQYYADLGFAAYFCKPITSSTLFDAMAIVVKGGCLLNGAAPLVTRHYINSINTNNTTSVKDSRPPNETKILLVDDNLVNQEVGLGILEILGYQADIAANGIEAITTLSESADQTPYDLVLMDCQMPEMDGYEATYWIRLGDYEGKSIPQADIPIIAMTANAMKGDKEKCLNAGMNDYLPKPVNPDELKEKLQRWLPA